MGDQLLRLARRAVGSAASDGHTLRAVERAVASWKSVSELRGVADSVRGVIAAGGVPAEAASRVIAMTERRIDQLVADTRWEGDQDQSRRQRIAEFIDFVADKLDIDELPQITISDDKSDVMELRSLGYMVRTGTVWVYSGERYLPDVLRTLAHELVHWKQHSEGRLSDAAGEDGSDEENEANSMAAVLMREYGRRNPRIFESRR